MDNLAVGVDVGGTFTDLVLMDNQGHYQTFKASSTPHNPSKGVLDVLRKAALCRALSLEVFLGQVRFFVLGTTVATNALIQGRGAKVGLITTKGFRDVLEIRCGRILTTQAAVWDLRSRPPRPLVPRYLRYGVQERVDKEGKVLIPLNVEDVEKALKLFQEEGVESVTVSLLFSFANPSHEQRIREILHEGNAARPISLSSEISPTIKEYERTSSTVVNAFIQPLVSKYLSDLEVELRQKRLSTKIMVTQSNGGLMDVAYASSKPITTLLSGPAAGATGANFYGQLIGTRNLVLMDTGGTSCDISLIKDGMPVLRDYTDVANYYVQTPSIDIHIIGTGGGSIARVDSGGLLHVGPQSAGADPGPACYDKGGKEPTVTDAYVLLGLINPDYFLGGEIPLVKAYAGEAIEAHVARPLGISPEDAAAGIVQVSNQQMADAIRRISLQKGEDIRDYMLVAAGGAGPVCAALVARDLGISRTLCPRMAPAFCAMGMLVADLRHDFVRSHVNHVRKLDLEKVNSIFKELEDVGRKTLVEEGADEETISLTRSTDMRYYLQVFEIEIPVPEPLIREEQLYTLGQRFSERHEELYGFQKAIDEVELVNLRVVAIGKIGKKTAQHAFGQRSNVEETKDGLPRAGEVRSVYVPNTRLFFEVPVFRGLDVRPGFVTRGPAIVEEVASTVIAYAGQTLRVDTLDNFVITENKEASSG